MPHWDGTPRTTKQQALVLLDEIEEGTKLFGLSDAQAREVIKSRLRRLVVDGPEDADFRHQVVMLEVWCWNGFSADQVAGRGGASWVRGLVQGQLSSLRTLINRLWA